MKIVRFCCLLVCLFFSLISIAQDNNLSEEIKQVKSLIAKDLFSDARSVLEESIKLNADNLEIKLLYAECILMDAENKSAGIEILEPALFEYVGKDLLNAKFILAQLYHREYFFDKAITLYSDLDTLLTLNSIVTDYGVLIAQCNSAKKMMSDIKAVQVQPVKTTTKDKVVSDYNKIIGRKLSSSRKYKSKPANMASIQGKKMKDQLSILEIDGAAMRMYPEFKFNKLGKADKDLVHEIKEPGTDWYNREYVGDIVNSDYDEDYPYLSLDNQTLYFCSNGPESMGGYDIFKCNRDSITGYWGKPINMGFPINSTADEYLFVEDSADMVAYFASSRFRNFDEVTVYRMPIKKAYSTNVSFYVNRAVKNSGSLSVSEVSVARINDFQYVFYGSLDPEKNRILYTVEELEQLSVVFLLSDGSKYEYSYCSPSSEVGLEVVLSLEIVDSIVCLNKKETIDKSSNTQLLGMMSGLGSYELNKTKKSNKLKLTERSDSINFLKITEHLASTKEKRKVHEAWFSSFFIEARKVALGLKSWLYADEKYKITKLKQQKKAEESLNLLVASSIVYEMENSFLSIVRDEELLLEEVKFVIDSLGKMPDNVLNQRKKEKLFEYFTMKYSELNNRFLAAKNERNAYLEVLSEVKLSTDLDKNEFVQKTNYNISRRALLLEERKAAHWELENAWWRRKKRKMRELIAEVDSDLFAVNQLLKKDSLAEGKRSKTVDFVAQCYRVKDWRYKNSADGNYLFIENGLGMGVIDSSAFYAKQQLQRFAKKEGLAPSSLVMVESESELLGANIDYVLIKDLLNIDWAVFEDKSSGLVTKEKEKFKLDTLAVQGVMAEVKDDLMKEDVKMFREHIVSEKETIYSIARKYNATGADIIKWNVVSEENVNGINWNDSTRIGYKMNWLYTGEKIRVILKHKVESGNTLQHVASKYGCSTDDIKKWNTKSRFLPNGIDWANDQRTGAKLDWLYEGELLIIGKNR